MLIGVSEIFASITSLEFFYSQAPSTMRSVSQACNLFTNALGSWLTIPLTMLVNINQSDMWVTSNVDNGHLDYYFFLLAALMFLALIVFWYLAATFVYVDASVLDILTRLCETDDSRTEDRIDMKGQSTGSVSKEGGEGGGGLRDEGNFSVPANTFTGVDLRGSGSSVASVASVGISLHESERGTLAWPLATPQTKHSSGSSSVNTGSPADDRTMSYTTLGLGVSASPGIPSILSKARRAGEVPSQGRYTSVVASEGN